MMVSKPRSVSAFIICIMFTSLWAQTSQQLASKYPLVSAYEVRPGILMTAKYASDGQVCEMVLEGRHFGHSMGVNLGSTIPANLSEQLIDELVPASERGKPTKSRWLDTDIGGGVVHTTREYDNVSIELFGSSCVPSKASQKDGSQQCDTGGDEVIVIRWKHRACVAPNSTITTH